MPKSPADMQPAELLADYTRLRDSMKALLSKARTAEEAVAAGAQKEHALKAKALEVVKRCKVLEGQLAQEQHDRAEVEEKLVAAQSAQSAQSADIIHLQQELETMHLQASASAEVLTATQVRACLRACVGLLSAPLCLSHSH